MSPGMNLSPIINPSGGVMRCSPEGTGGRSRRASLMQAWRNFILESLDWSSSVAPGKQVSNSCWSLTHSVLFVAKRKNRLDRVAAVVSLNMEELLSFPSTPVLLLCVCSSYHRMKLEQLGNRSSIFLPCVLLPSCYGNELHIRLQIEPVLSTWFLKALKIRQQPGEDVWNIGAILSEKKKQIA